MLQFYHYQQPDEMDCGPTCLRMVAEFYGKNYSIDRLGTQAEYSKKGFPTLYRQAAENIGLKTAYN